MYPPTQLTVSSSTVSRGVNLDYQSAKYVSFAVSGSSSGTFSANVEGSLDDLSLTSSPFWFTLTSAAVTANSCINVFLGPLAGIRLNVGSASSASVTLRILQGIGG